MFEELPLVKMGLRGLSLLKPRPHERRFLLCCALVGPSGPTLLTQQKSKITKSQHEKNETVWRHVKMWTALNVSGHVPSRRKKKKSIIMMTRAVSV